MKPLSKQYSRCRKKKFFLCSKIECNNTDGKTLFARDEAQQQRDTKKSKQRVDRRKTTSKKREQVRIKKIVRRESWACV